MKKYVGLAVTLFAFAGAFAQTASPARDYSVAVLWQQHAGEYRALCFQAYSFARISLDGALKASDSTKKNCVVVDIDETVLDNSAFQGHEIKKGISFSQKDWTEWTNLAAADTVPGALSFLNYAASRQVETFYISNRESADSLGTLKNLQQFGFPFADGRHLLLKHGTSDKEPRRQALAAAYNILLLCGDNLSDFSNEFYRQGKDTKACTDKSSTWFGTKYIVLPNPMYGDWEQTIYEHKHGISEQQRSEIRLQKLKDYSR
ncbi:5'-nucleotidase, lipoprotein e(P4) family [Pedobacter sp. BS3]|nr:5'-nucleotidase, lipoprotein e(P4) family [Pedobacter sp. BS3]